jgi:hypothetical protein
VETFFVVLVLVFFALLIGKLIRMVCDEQGDDDMFP